ncbi:MAG: hypothetical protein AAGA90_02895 [Actinomycetota bacterium]
MSQATLTRPTEHQGPIVDDRVPAVDAYEDVFPRWVTLSLMVAWMAVMVWAFTYATITFT